MNKFAYILLFTIISNLSSLGQYYNGLISDFGKNRIQHTEYRWSFYKYDQYDVYFYEEGKNLGDYVALSAHLQIKEFEQTFEFDMESKIEFIIYNTQSQSRESNIGNLPEESGNIGGSARTVGTKVFLYFNGDHKDFDVQIRTGVAKIILNELMYGGNYKEVLKNSALFSMPKWFETGLVSYLSENWNIEIENEVKNGILNGQFSNFNNLIGEKSRIAGHSMWYYIADVYGESVIPNILFMAKSNRNIENGFMFVIGKSLESFTQDWLFYYESRFKNDNIGKKSPGGFDILKKPKSTRVYQRIKLNHDGNLVAYVSNEYSQQKVWIHDLKNKKKKRILKLGHRLDITSDYSYPVLAWHPSNNLLSIFYESKGQIIWLLYDVERKEKIKNKIFHFEKVIDVSYSQDGSKFAFSAVKNGKTDIYVYDIQSRTHNPITNDFYDDRYPVFVNGGKHIIFSSNRVNDTLGVGGNLNTVYQKSKDLFMFDFSKKKTNRFEPQILRRLTNTKLQNETNPKYLNKNSFIFQSDKNGIKNQFLATFDSAIAFVDTAIHYRYFTIINPISNLNTNILSSDLRNGFQALIYLENGNYKLTNQKFEIPLIDNLSPTTFRKQIDVFDTAKIEVPKKPKILTVDSIKTQMRLDSDYVNIDYYIFEDEINSKSSENSKQVFNREKKITRKFTPFVVKNLPTADTVATKAKMRNYELAFKTSKVGITLDNRFLNPSYQRFTGSAGLPNLGVNGFTKYGVVDLMEDYFVSGGYRIGDFYSNEVFLAFSDRRNKTDKQYLFYRSTHLDLNAPGFTRNVAYEAITRLSFPLSMVDRIETNFAIRYDNFIPLSVSKENLMAPLVHELWPNIRLNYTWDNTRPIALNLREGVKAKVFAEYYQQIPDFKKYMLTIGFDYRKYINLYHGLIWATRFGGGTSFGSQRLMYYLGGSDGWLTPKFNSELPPGELQDGHEYSFQTQALNLRGFQQNTRNGPSFVVANTELRWPIIKQLFNRPINSKFLRNFQVIAFGDVGTAWSGPSPFSEENSFNQNTVEFGSEDQPNKIFVTTHKEPIVAGYGFGARSKLWGYFVRADWAWGVEDGIKKDGVFYVSLSLDF